MHQDSERRLLGLSLVRRLLSPVLGLWVLLCFLVYSAPETLAEEPEEVSGQESQNVFELGEIVVSEKKSTAHKVATVTEVNRDDFISWGASSVADALRYVPGATVSFSRGSLAGNGKQESLIRLRGFETTDVLILLDGMPMTEPYMKRVDLTQITLDGVSKIKVVKGPSSVLYGANTAGGIINIVSSEVGGFQTYLDERFSDYKTLRYLGQHSGEAGPLYYSLAGSLERSDGFPVSRDFTGAQNQQGRLRENSDLERYNFTGRVGADIGTSGNVSVGGGYYTFNGGVPYDMASPNPSTLWRKDWDRWYVNGFAEWIYTDQIGVKGQVFYSRFGNKIKTYTDTSFQEIAGGGTGISTYDNTLMGYFVNPYWDLGRISSLNLGLRYDNDHVEIQSETNDVWRTYESEIFAFSLEDEIRPYDSLSLVAGIGYNLYRKIEAYDKPPGDDSGDVNFQTGIHYTPCSWLNLHGSVSQKTSYPTMRQLYSPEAGNEDLTGQRALSYEIGAAIESEKHYPAGSLTLFRSDVDQMIGKRETPNDPDKDFEYYNIGEATLQGVELSVHWSPIDPLIFLVNYTFLDTEGSDPDRVLKELDYRSPHTCNVEARYRSSFGLEGSIRYSYASAQKYEMKIDSTDYDERVAVLPARGLWGMHLGQKVPFKSHPEEYVEVYMDLENLLDEYYEEDPGKAAPGRRVWVGVRLSF